MTWVSATADPCTCHLEDQTPSKMADIDHISHHSDEEIDDPTRCYCGAEEQPVERCGPCLEYRMWQAAAREVSAMDAPTANSIPIAEFRILIDRFQATADRAGQIPIVVAILACAQRHPDFMAEQPTFRQAVRQRCQVWVGAAREACMECLFFLNSLWDKHNYIASDDELEQTVMPPHDEYDGECSTAERLVL